MEADTIMAGTRPVPRWLLEQPIAHRGLHDNLAVPENSLAAFSAAIRAGMPIELDVHLLADQQVVVFHDDDLARMTGTEGLLAARDTPTLRSLRLLQTQEPIPLFAEVLRLVDGAVPLLIELKSMRLRVGELERAVLQALQGYGGAFALQSFNPLSVAYFRRHAPSICRGQLSLGRVGVPLTWRTRPDFIAYRVENLPNRSVSRLQRSGTPLLAWTICDWKQYERACALADNYIFERTPDFVPPFGPER